MSWDLVKQLFSGGAEASNAVTFGYWLVLASFAGLEFVLPQLKGSHRSRRWPANFGFGLINMTLIPLAPISGVLAAEWARRNGIGLLNYLGQYWLLTALIATIAVLSFLSYAIHFFSHKIPWLWRVHRVHHFDTSVDVSTGLRHHPLALAINIFVVVPVAIVFGLSPGAMIAYGFTEALFELFTHANVRLPTKLDHVLRLILVTPRIHAIHHSAYQPETDSNYGGVFTIWDRIFGTYCDFRADCPEKLQFGLTELQDHRATDLWWQLWSPLIKVSNSRSLLVRNALTRKGKFR